MPEFCILHLYVTFCRYQPAGHTTPHGSAADPLLFLFFGLCWHVSALKERQENLYNIPDHLSGMQPGCADHSSQRIWCTWASFLHLADWHLCRTSHCKTHLRSGRKKKRTINRHTGPLQQVASSLEIVHWNAYSSFESLQEKGQAAFILLKET